MERTWERSHDDIQLTKLTQIAQEFRRYKLTILGFGETRWKESGEKRLSTGETLLYSGKPLASYHSSEVGFLLSQNAKQYVQDWVPVSYRIVTARFKTRTRSMMFLQVYAPTKQADISEKEAFYEQLTHTLVHIRNSDIVVLIGDLNAMVADCNNKWDEVIGKHGLGKID